LNGDLKNAIESYTRATASPDAAVAACFEAANLELSAGKTSQADVWVERLSSTDPENGAILEAYLLRQNGDAQAVEAYLQRATADFGDGSDSALELAWVYAMQRDRGRASALYETLAESSGNNAGLAMLGAELRALDANLAEPSKSDVANAWEAARRKEFGAAQRLAEPFSAGPNATPWASVVLGYCALSQGAPREAERLLRLASYELPTSSMVRDLLTEARRGATERNADRPTQIAAVSPDWRTLWNAGRLRPLLDNQSEWGNSDEIHESLYVAALVTGNTELAATLAARLAGDSWLKPFAAEMNVAVDQRSPSGLLELINAWTPQEDRDVVLVRNASARAYAVAQLRARSLEQILVCLVEAPDNSIALYNLATLYREAAMPSHELEAWRRLLSQHPDHEEARERVYALLIHQRRYTDARRAAEAAYVSDPNDASALIRLADASFKTGDADFALAALVKNAQIRPGDRMAARALARGYLVLGEGENALAALENHPDEHDLKAFALAMLGAWNEANAETAASGRVPLLDAALSLRADNYDDAESVLQRTPLSTSARILMDALLGRKDADASVNDFAFRLGSQAEALLDFALGSAYSASGLAQPALARWQIVGEAVGSNTELTALMLSELARTGVVPEKATLAQELVEQHDGSPGIWIGLADVYASLEDSIATSEALLHAAALAGDSAEGWQAIALRIDESDSEFMLRAFRNLNRLRPDDPLVQNNFAYALLQSGQSNPNPLALAESAFDALGTRSHVLHTLGLAMANVGRIEDAREKLYQALEQRPGDPTLMLDFGKALIAQGENEEGLRLVEMSISYADRLRVTFPRRDEAQSLLAKEAV
jgi:thioredoxin-like negative regulator of GroEL